MTSSRPLRVLVAFSSLSGNTRELARQVRAHCEAAGHAVSWVEAGMHTLADAGDPRHDLYLLGSWTDNAGRTPAEMKALIAALVEAVGKPAPLAVFGTGETQWGEEYYCGALRRIATFFGSRLPRLEIEQMPHGRQHARQIQHWTAEVLALATSMRHADGASTGAHAHAHPARLHA